MRTRRWVPFVRGDDGLTNRQRRKSAKVWAAGSGRRSTAAEMDRLEAAYARLVRDCANEGHLLVDGYGPKPHCDCGKVRRDSHRLSDFLLNDPSRSVF